MLARFEKPVIFLDSAMSYPVTGTLAEPGPGGHPLFPRSISDTGPDLRRFDLIEIRRKLHGGTWEISGQRWRGSELRSWEQIVNAYGGECTYQLVALCGRTKRIQAWSEKFRFDSPPRKPFPGAASTVSRVERPAPPTAPTPAPAPAPMPPVYGYPYASHYTGAPAQEDSSQIFTLLQVALDQQAKLQAVMMEALVRQRTTQPANSALSTALEWLRVLAPIVQARREQELEGMLQGIKLGLEAAREARPVAPRPASDDAALASALAVIKQHAESQTEVAPSAPAVLQEVSSLAPNAAPPGAPPAGMTWMSTPIGWALVPLAPSSTDAPRPAPVATDPAPSPAIESEAQGGQAWQLVPVACIAIGVRMAERGQAGSGAVYALGVALWRLGVAASTRFPHAPPWSEALPLLSPEEIGDARTKGPAREEIARIVNGLLLRFREDPQLRARAMAAIGNLEIQAQARKTIEAHVTQAQSEATTALPNSTAITASPPVKAPSAAPPSSAATIVTSGQMNATSPHTTRELPSRVLVVRWPPESRPILLESAPSEVQRFAPRTAETRAPAPKPRKRSAMRHYARASIRPRPPCRVMSALPRRPACGDIERLTACELREFKAPLECRRRFGREARAPPPKSLCIFPCSLRGSLHHDRARTSLSLRQPLRTSGLLYVRQAKPW